LIQIYTHLDIQPPPVRTQTRALVGRSPDLAVVDPQGLQAERGAVWKERGGQVLRGFVCFKETALEPAADGFRQLPLWFL